MVFLNYTTMQMTAKIVYYGPGLCGKTTNLQWIHEKTAPRSRGEMVSLETEGDRTLFFDLLPLDVGIIGGMKVRLQLYTVPGQVFYNATRRLVLKGVDGVVFVADSQVPALEPNEESLANLKQNLEELGLNPSEIPLVLQYNKRDIRNILPVERLEKALNPAGAPHFEAAAIHGVGVFETLKEISRLGLDVVRRRLEHDAAPAAAGATAPDSPAKTGAEPKEPAPTPAGAAAAQAAERAADAPATPPPTTESKSDPALMEPLQVEFAEEDTGKLQVRPVRTKASIDIGKELEKLRSLASRGRSKSATAVKDRDVEELFKDLMGKDKDAAQEVKRRTALEVPAHLLKGLTDLRIHLGFDRDGREEILRDGVRVTLVGTRRLKRLRLHLDLEVSAKD
jgi:signal recognition particle receptor subunit beta